MTNPNQPPKRIKVGDRVTIVSRGVRGTYTAEYSDNGVHRRLSLRTRNLKLATQRALRLEAQLADGEFVTKPKSVRLAEAIADYLATKKTEHKSPKTLIKYGTELETFVAFAGQEGVNTLQRVTARLFDLYRRTRCEGRHEKTCYTECIILKGFFKWCLRRELIQKNPLQSCEVRKPPFIPRMAPTLADVNLLLENATSPRRIQLAILAFTGMRAGELQKLRPEDLDLEGGWIHIRSRVEWTPKNRQSRTVPIHARLRQYLAELPRGTRPYVLCAPPSRKYPQGDHQISIKHLLEYLQRLAVSLQMVVGRKNDGLVTHSLRHFFETTCVNAGIPQRVIDVWMGHTGNKSMGAVYYRLHAEESQVFMNKVTF